MNPKRYKIALDLRKGLFDELPVIEAQSPKEAAELYAGKVTRHLEKYGGEIAVAETHWPCKTYLYDRKE
jgi:hypothetical protein